MHFPEPLGVAVGVAVSSVLTALILAFKRLRAASAAPAASPPHAEVTTAKAVPDVDHGQLILKVQRANIKELATLRSALKVLHGEIVALKSATQQMRVALDHYHQDAQPRSSAPMPAPQLPLDIALQAIKQGCGADECARLSGVDLETIEILIAIHAPSAQPQTER